MYSHQHELVSSIHSTLMKIVYKFIERIESETSPWLSIYGDIFHIKLPKIRNFLIENFKGNNMKLRKESKNSPCIVECAKTR